jgi:predicted nucleic acid-binding protein
MIFVDTSFWVALRNRRDAHHDEAVELLEQHAAVPLVTTNHVRGETWTLLRRRSGLGAAVDFLDAVQSSPRLELVFADGGIEDEALRLRRRGLHRAASLNARRSHRRPALRIRGYDRLAPP